MTSGPSTVNISVIVVTYGRNSVLEQTLRCLLRQQPAPLEIIVVDQTREHDEPTQKFLDELVADKRIIHLYQAEPNAQRARNRAIEEASGEVLLFVDDDVWMDEGLVEAHWKNYADPDLAAVCGFYLDPGEQPLDEFPDDWQISSTNWIYFPHRYSKRIECHCLPTCNGSIRKNIAIRLGGFDENYTFTHFDDTDFSCRLKELGVKSIHDPEAKLLHLKEPSGGKRPGSLNDHVIADSNHWYIWCYFFWMNFRWRGRQEIAMRLRGCVFRRQNIVRPWYLIIALAHFGSGAFRAVRAIRGGRKLGFEDETEITYRLPQLPPRETAPHL